MDPPVFAYLSNDTVYPAGQRSSPILGVQPTQWHDTPVLTATGGADHSQEYTSSHDTTPAHPAQCILQLYFD
jgi:hypothetical protein